MGESDEAAVPAGGERGRGTVDAADLRRRMLVSFSAQELAELAATLGVASARPGAGAEEHAREIVRSHERRRDLAGLVARLREARPLLEWPAIATGEGGDPEPADAPAGVPEAATRTVATEPEAATEPTAHSEPGATAEPSATAPWPATEPVATEPAPRSSGLDPRILVLVSGLTVVAALVAFAAGRVSSSAAPHPAADDPSAAPGSQRRAPGPATHAANAVARGLAGVASACEIPASDDAEVLRRAMERCGPAPIARAPRPAPEIPDVPASAAPAASDEPATGRYGIPAPTPAAQTPGQGPCLRGCEATHAACSARCGKEPTQGSQYGDYQICLAKCLSSASKCRLACQ